uniref:Kinesin motor domain-containing protein n=1 Tax=Parastrongyloides trichosuri TaxID=131310 RepID=A0A0N4Z172_PARTI
MFSTFSESSILYGKGGKSCVKVGIRIRPRTEKEIQNNDRNIVNVINDTSIEVLENDTGKIFKGFDFVFGEDTTQSYLYKMMISEYIPKLLSGINCTIFAYGQTGTGKTFTMEGSSNEVNEVESFEIDCDNNIGVISRTIQHILLLLNIPTCIRKIISIRYVELYNEEVYDLLGDDIKKKLDIYEDFHNGGVLLKEVKEYKINSMKEVFELIKKGKKSRKTSSTSMNQRSSRSHAIFTVMVDWDETSGMNVISRKSKINLVDLAGCENIGKSGATKGSAREAGNINTSLLALGQVINYLTEKNSHIPYRSSKLTRILKDSLGGSSMTCLIATISPTMSNKSESLSTLEYGMKAMNIQNDIKINIKTQRNKNISDSRTIDVYLKIISDIFKEYKLKDLKNQMIKIIDNNIFNEMDKTILQIDFMVMEMKKWKNKATISLSNYRKLFTNQCNKLTKIEKEFMNQETEIERLVSLLINNIEELDILKFNINTYKENIQGIKLSLTSDLECIQDKIIVIKKLLLESNAFNHYQIDKIKIIKDKFLSMMNSYNIQMEKYMEKSGNDLNLEIEKLIGCVETNLKNKTSFIEKNLLTIELEKEKLISIRKEQDLKGTLIIEAKELYKQLEKRKLEKFNLILFKEKEHNKKCKKFVEHLQHIRNKASKLVHIKEEMSKMKYIYNNDYDKELYNLLKEIDEMNL